MSTVDELNASSAAFGRETVRPGINYKLLYLTILLAIISAGFVFRIWFEIEAGIALKQFERNIDSRFRSR